MENRRQPPSFSPWSIGVAHWNQRDLYTRNARVDDSGYARGPSIHPEIGSYAYERDASPAKAVDPDFYELYEHEAWPWLNYRGEEAAEDEEDREEQTRRVRREVQRALAFHDEIDARDIEVAIESSGVDVVTLLGTVPSRRERRLAGRVARSASGPLDVENRLEIRRDDTDMTIPLPTRAFG